MVVKHNLKPAKNRMSLRQTIPSLHQITQLTHTLNSLLASLAGSPSPQHALLLYNHLRRRRRISHNHFTFTHALKACSRSRALQKGLEIHAHVLKSGDSSDVFISNSLLHFYFVVNRIASARRVFDSIAYPDVVSWTSIVSGLARSGFGEEALFQLSLMEVKPNSTTLVSALSACTGLGALRLGKAVHGYCVRNLNGVINVILDNAVLEFYLKCGSLDSARYLFVKMPKRDVVSWTSMIGGYAMRGLFEEAIWVFQDMLERCEAEPNEATIVNVLSACSSSGALSAGQWVHSYLSSRYDLAAKGLVGNALINMYAKCGDVGMAIRVFKKLKCKDIISWTTIINGMAMNGHGMYALQLFTLMVVSEIAPDSVTFITLLSACGHAGLINQGLMFFKALRDVYGIVPQMEHYTCIVDMYGRAGLLEKAEAFVREMPVKADATIWKALLNACRIHGNEELFERIKQCMENNSESVDIGILALLSNTYASNGKWEDVDNIQSEIMCKGLKKMPGCSWIET